MKHRTFLSALACCVIFLGTSALARAQSPVTCGGVFPAVEDATIDSNLPNDPLGDSEVLEAGGIAAGERRILLHFDVAGSIPPGSTIDSVALELTNWDSGNIAFDFSVFPLVSPWYEFNVTWRNQPGTGEAIATRTLQLPQFGSATIDVTDVMTLWANGTLVSPDLELVSASPWDEIRLASSESGWAPLLHITCSPPAPQLVAPADGDDAVQQQTLNQLRGLSSRPVILRLDGGAITSAEMGIPTPATMAGDSLVRADWFLDQFRGLLRSTSPTDDLQLSRRSTDGLHLFYRQRHTGVPVFPGELGVHLSQNEVVGLSGRYTLRIDLDNVPRLGDSLARELAVVAAGTGAAATGATTLTYLDLRTMKHGDQQVHLAWKTTVTGGTTPGTYFVDAVSGQVLLTLPLDEDAFVLRLSTGGGANPGGGFPNTCWYPTTADRLWFNEAGVITGPSPDAQGFTAFANALAVNNFWRGTLFRDGHDGNGGMEGYFVHVNLPGNAHYESTCNVFEFGENMGVLDAMAHEFTHGVIRFEAGLAYMGESGALNESYADLFAYMVDPNNFTIGELVPGGTLRTLNNPPAACPAIPQDCTQWSVRNCNPDHMRLGLSGDRCGKRTRGIGETEDFGWVHTNSGIPNKAGALIIAGGTHNGFTITGLGRTKAAQLFYDVINNRLGPYSQFIDARDHAFLSARLNPHFSLHDACDVRNAYASVGIGAGDVDCDGIDDAADPDSDNDGVPDTSDNCVTAANPGQQDHDGDAAGDACDPDIDGDTVPNAMDNCPLTGNTAPFQADWNNNGIGDACDDSDFDFILDAYDNCRSVANRDQTNSDGDPWGNACDPDDDGDGLYDNLDNCPGIQNTGGSDVDGDGVGDVCDNCPRTYGVSGHDFDDPDHDGRGNVCDTDDDGDGVPDATDNCPATYNPGQADFDFNGNGTGCDIFETRALYEAPSFWEQGRFIRWEIPDSALEIPIAVCPGCPGAFLPHGFTEILTVQADVNVSLRIVDRAGMTRANDYTFRPDHQLAFRPAAFAKSLFDYGGFFDGGPHAVIPKDLSRIVHPDQEAYSLLVYPEPGTDITGYHTLQMVVHQCADDDGDGAFGGDATCLALGPADCNDKDAAMFPGNPEVCDNKDNNCDAIIDGFATQCGLGGCAATGYCSSGLDSCQPGSPGQEVCDGLDNNCDGVVDNGQPPAPDIDVIVSASQVSWSFVPDTASWDIAFGSLTNLTLTQGDFSLSTMGCLAHRYNGTSIVDALGPVPGDGVWFLVRGNNCVGAGSYDEAGGDQARSRDPGMNAFPYGCQDCSHSLCDTGPALTAICDACAGQVCSFDPYCCTAFWDSICVAEADGTCALGCF